VTTTTPVPCFPKAPPCKFYSAETEGSRGQATHDDPVISCWGQGRYGHDPIAAASSHSVSELPWALHTYAGAHWSGDLASLLQKYDETFCWLF
jgi:hypothetical protein